MSGRMQHNLVVRGRRLALALAVAGVTTPLGASAWADSRVLFIGNSITYTNQLPLLIQQMRNADGHVGDFSYTMVANSGWSLLNHWNDSGPASAHWALANAGTYDDVVLQDFSSNPVLVPDQTRTYSRLWHSEILSCDPAATTIMFSTWQRQDYPNSQGINDSVYGGLAAEFGGWCFVPGDAWLTVTQQRPDIPLYVDYVHPTLAGSYLAAAVFYSQFYHNSPIGLAGPAGLSSDTARYLQTVAWQTVGTAVWNPVVTSGQWNVPGNWDFGTPAAAQAVSLEQS
ncbi:MAG: SGNH/GDSL hydrolase family protein, partial [Tepidisphaerales bacterium]